jgi:hypothetical protein
MAMAWNEDSIAVLSKATSDLDEIRVFMIVFSLFMPRTSKPLDRRLGRTGARRKRSAPGLCKRRAGENATRPAAGNEAGGTRFGSRAATAYLAAVERIFDARVGRAAAHEE